MAAVCSSGFIAAVGKVGRYLSSGFMAAVSSSGNRRQWREISMAAVVAMGCKIPKNRDKRLSLENFAGFNYDYVI